MKRILINTTPQENRIAVMEDNGLAEFLVERNREKGCVGNIKILLVYRGNGIFDFLF